MIIKADMRGFDGVIAQLDALPKKAGGNFAREAIKRGMEPMLQAARSNAKGSLKAGTKKRVQPLRKDGARGLVGTGATDNLYTGKTFYGAFVELGHRVGPRKLGNSRAKVEGTRFLRRAFDETAETCMTIIGEYVADALTLAGSNTPTAE